MQNDAATNQLQALYGYVEYGNDTEETYSETNATEESGGESVPIITRTINASDVKFSPSEQNYGWSVNTVEEALDYLYGD